MMLSTVLYVTDKSLVISGTAYLFVCSYAVCALYRIYVFNGGQKPLSMITVALLSFLSSLLILAIQRKSSMRAYLRGMLLVQAIVPFTMLIYLASKYKYGENYIHIHIPYRIQILIALLIFIFFIEAVFKICNKWNTAFNINEIITCGTCISIMSFNRYSGSGSIISPDLHHPYENVIGYSQIFELGQKAFAEYIPVSGMYSVVHGFFLSFFGHGQVSFYHMTTNLFFLTVIILIVMLLKKQIEGEWMLLISLIFTVIDYYGFAYNRVVFIAPIMILLACPKLIERKNLWLKAWFLSSFLHGLYYPVLGTAVCLGFLPLGLWQIATYIKTGELRKDMKKISFRLWWLFCCIPVGCGFPLLIGTAKHMRAMAGQTVYADGITRFGQVVPDNFFSYIQSLSTRLIIYYLFSYLIVISIVWVSVALCLKVGNVKLENRRIKIDHPIPAFISLSFGIALLIAFSFTAIRMDINSIYARSTGMVYAAFILMMIIISRYMPKMENRFWIFGFAIFIIAAISGAGFLGMESDSKLAAYYTVPEDYVYVANCQVERLGECFVDQGIYNSIIDTYNYISNMDKNESYLGVVPNFGLFYLCDIKGDSVMEIGMTIKGYEAAQETVDLIQDNHTIVGPYISSVDNYYFYHWLVTSGEYIWNPETRVFLPNDDSVSPEEILAQNQNIDVSADGAVLGRTAGSWGSSMEELMNIFDNTDFGYTIEIVDKNVDVNFEQFIDGNNADFIYIEFADMDQNYQYTLFNLNENFIQDTEDYWYIKGLMKKDYNRDIVVVISWEDESGAIHNMNCRMERGKLLIPQGAGRGWLLNKHKNLTISVMQGEETIAVPEITEIKMLKLREIEGDLRHD